MIKIIFAILFAILGSIVILLSEVMSDRIDAVKKIDQSYKEDIAELQKIEKTNSWIKKQEIDNLFYQQKNFDTAETDMISFYDQAPKEIGFKISKYIYDDVDAKMDISFNCTPTSANDLYRLFSLNYNGGFIKFNNVNIKQGELSGDITLIQPIRKDVNGTK